MFYLFILVEIRIAYHQYNTSLNPNKKFNYLLIAFLQGIHF